MLTVYHLKNSRSDRIIWLMEELGLPYELKHFDRNPDMTSPPELAGLHPLGRAPAIVDGDTLLVESGAIVEYIIQRHGGGRLSVGPDAPNYARYLQWMHAAEGSVMPRFVMALFMGGTFPGVDQDSVVAARVKREAAKMVEFVESELGSRSYFAGDEFTAADIMTNFCFGIMSFTGTDLTQFPNISAYKARIAARPAYQKAMALANPKKD